MQADATSIETSTKDGIRFVCRKYEAPPEFPSPGVAESMGSATLAIPVNQSYGILVEFLVGRPKVKGERWRVMHGYDFIGDKAQKDEVKRQVIDAVGRKVKGVDPLVSELKMCAIGSPRLRDLRGAAAECEFTLDLGQLGWFKIPGWRVLFVGGKPVTIEPPKDMAFEGDYEPIERQLLAQLRQWLASRMDGERQQVGWSGNEGGKGAGDDR